MAKQYLRNRSGALVGWTDTNGSRTTARDRAGFLVGTYDQGPNQTRDRGGRLIGTGNLLASLIVTAL